MRWHKATSLSLNRTVDLIPLALGSAIGISNFFALPELVLNRGGFTILLFHGLGLLILGATLLLAEFAWSRWLVRPFVNSYETLYPRLGGLSQISFLAVGLIAPPYLLQIGRLLALAVGYLFHAGAVDLAMRVEIEKSVAISWLSAVFVLSLGMLCVYQGPAKIARLMRVLIWCAFLGWTAVAVYILNKWGNSGFQSLLHWDSSRVDPKSIFEVLGFSLFTLSSGFGIMYTFCFYASQAPMSQQRDLNFWRIPGSLLRVVTWVVLGDLAASLLSLAIVSPFALANASEARASATTLLLEWLPQILANNWEGRVLVIVFFISLFCAGFASAISLLDFGTFNLEKGMKWTRKRASIHVLVVGMALLALPLVPAISMAMNWVGSHILLPIAALCLSLMVGWKMPFRAQQNVLGRGLMLDQVLRIWRFSIRFLTPAFLIYYLLRQFFQGWTP